MFYYLVWVRSSRYHGQEALTYCSEARIATGSLVQVQLQKDMVMGFVSGPASPPRFQTKPIVRLYDLPPLPPHLLKLAQWLQAYYPAPQGTITQQLIPASLSEKQLQQPAPGGFSAGDLTTLPPLTSEQSAALAAMTARGSYVVHGKTGSGKTRLYIELAAQTIDAGRSAIVLTPEISLTSQLAANFRAVFGERVIVMHSQQAPTERQKAWLDALKAREPVIVIGPRSALFSPVANLGLIVLDEAHEAAYKQEQAPQYQTGRVAAYLASLTPSRLVLGSATPSVSDYYLALQKNKPIIRLESLARAPEGGNGERQTMGNEEAATRPAAVKQSSPADTRVEFVDMKDRSAFPRSPHLSLPLIKAVEAALARGEQALLYLNRRGTARLIMCENCGWQATCPHCDLPLTYHGDSHELRCHSCNHHQSSPTSCPACGHPSILFRTAGTKAIVEAVKTLFPQARVMRFDTDNTKAERFEQHYEAVKRGDVDILIGAQLLAKGLDLPRLSTLGVLLADTSLYLPDFSAQERTFQLLTQVLGRIGRGHVAGRAIIQTYHPDHPVLLAAVAQDYQRFYEAEVRSREAFLFPPFCYLLKLTVRRSSLHAVEQAAEKLKAAIERSGHHVRVEGPAPAFYERFQNKYQWQLVIKAKNRSELLKVIAELPTNVSYDLDPIDLL